MEINKKPYPLGSLNGLKDKITTESKYQRLPVWKTHQKKLLIDSILRGYDIPKVYVKKEDPSSGREFEVIDGQQRLLAIWGYFNNEFGLPRDAEPIDGIDCASHTIEQLHIDLRTKLDIYIVDFVIVTSAEQTEEKDEIGELFLRLQNGSPLNPQEKRNAMPGNMRDFIKDLAEHSFFKNCMLRDFRYSYDQLAAQLTLLELSGGPTNISTAELNKMYKEKTDFLFKSREANQVKNILKILENMFPKKIPQLVNHNVVTLYCLISRLTKFYACNDKTWEDLLDWFLKFEEERGKNDALDDEEKDGILAGYTKATGNSSDKHKNIEKRLNLMQERFFLAAPDIKKLDDDRLFNYEQKLAIFRRDEAKCQVKMKCDGVETLGWDEWEADHIEPHSKGGETIVSNGQVACITCNRSKSNKQ